jgi:hypothetical protein
VRQGVQLLLGCGLQHTVSAAWCYTSVACPLYGACQGDISWHVTDSDPGVCCVLLCRLEELRHPMLGNLAAALPTIGNGLAAVVGYGEAHIFMVQLQSTAAAAHARAAAASQAIQDAAADEVRALTSGSTAAKDVASLTSDYRRLCGLAASCIQSAGSWLGRHVETLQALGGAVNSSGSGGSALLAVQQADWDAATADRALLLASGNAAVTPFMSVSSSGGVSGNVHTSSGLLVQALRSFLPSSAAAAGGTDSSSDAAAAELQALLPHELMQHCMQLDGQGVQLLLQQQELVAQGRWSLAAYAAVLQQLLSGEQFRHFPLRMCRLLGRNVLKFCLCARFSCLRMCCALAVHSIAHLLNPS